MEMFNSKLLFILFYSVLAAPQNPEINDQFETTTDTDTTVFIETGNTVTEIRDNNVAVDNITVVTETPTTDIAIAPYNTQRKRPRDLEAGFFAKICTVITTPLKNIMSVPKVNSVLRNIGTCIVNGAMELISHYLPAPLMPLVASAAGMVIPFEPVVMLRDRMPVTSYRRAFQTAMNTFLGTFDKYKVDDNIEDDPYMTMRFNRRFMNQKPVERKKRNERNTLN